MVVDLKGSPLLSCLYITLSEKVRPEPPVRRIENEYV